MKTTRYAAFIFATMTAVIVACSGGSQADTPQIDLDPAGIDVQMTTVYKVKVINSGDADLVLTTAPVLGGALCPDSNATAFSLEVQAGAAFPYSIAPTDSVGEGENGFLELTVRFNDPTDLCPKTATLTIASNDLDSDPLIINITKAVIEPNISVDPNPLDLGFVAVDGSTIQDVMYIQNTGLAALEINRVDAIKHSDGFGFQWPCERRTDATGTEQWVADADAIIPITYEDPATRLTIDDTICAAPVVIQPMESLELPVFYTAMTATPAKATFRFYSNDPDFDPSLGEAYEASVQANIGGPCLVVTPELVDFGSVVVGTGVKGVGVTLYNCSPDTDLELFDIYRAEGTSDEFSFDLTTVGTFDRDHPLVIPQKESRNIVVKYTPVDINKDNTGKLIPDEGFMVIENNTPRQAMQVPLKGLGTEAECAVCQFTMESLGAELPDNASINPQDLISFSSSSYDPTPGGGIDKYEWTVDGPKDSVSVFMPTSTFRDPSFEPNVVGTYEFCLEVFNKDGCSDKCCQTVNVVPPQGCHIELSWNTPADKDQTDECSIKNPDCGSDMDLHLVHPNATGKTRDPADGKPYGYFDLDWDCYWMVKNPTWDDVNWDDPLHQPKLDRDDTSGGGPENWTYTIPDPAFSTTPPDCYRVGVHYYDDHGWGKSYPTIRVFINSSEAVYEKTLTTGMSTLDMWDVGRVCCSNVDTPFVERTNGDGTAHVVHSYQDESIQ
ncbi:MAG TPA: hypothetical protein PLY68_04890 [Myxococcota bacterium]|nr:hypothetical protein [Myxococcota bacterium]HQP95516.1 hypothetical protein [Myxococcota bacterium]